MAARVQKIPASLLKKFSEDCYVDSPVYFDAPPWVRWMNWAKLETLYGMAQRKNGFRVLDFACGNGIMFPTWEKGEEMTVGVDLHVTAADRVRSHFQLKKVYLSRAAGTLLPFSKGVFDLVFAASTLEHFPDLEWPLQEIRRVLRDGGQMLFLCPNENRYYDWGRRLVGYKKPADHYHSADEVVEVVRHFFRVEKLSCFPPWVPSPMCIYKMGRVIKE